MYLNKEFAHQVGKNKTIILYLVSGISELKAAILTAYRNTQFCIMSHVLYIISGN